MKILENETNLNRKTITNLTMLKPGETGKITNIESNGPIKRRLMDMGILFGEEIRVDKIAPLGDPIEVTIKSYSLSLRKTEAEGISVVINAN